MLCRKVTGFYKDHITKLRAEGIEPDVVLSDDAIEAFKRGIYFIGTVQDPKTGKTEEITEENSDEDFCVEACLTGTNEDCRSHCTVIDGCPLYDERADAIIDDTECGAELDMS